MSHFPLLDRILDKDSNLQEYHRQLLQFQLVSIRWNLAAWNIQIYSVLPNASLKKSGRILNNKHRRITDAGNQRSKPKGIRVKNAPVTTPRLAAIDWMMRAAQEATNMIQSNWNHAKFQRRGFRHLERDEQDVSLLHKDKRERNWEEKERCIFTNLKFVPILAIYFLLLVGF